MKPDTRSHPPWRDRSFLVKNSWRGALQLGAHLGLLSLTGYTVSLSIGSIWQIPSTIFHGFVLVFLFCALHETIHRTVFERRSVNDIVSWLLGLILVLPSHEYREFHFAHHRDAQIPERDPELRTKRIDRPRGLFLYLSGLSYWPRLLKNLWHQTMGHHFGFYVSKERRPQIVRQARFYVAIYVLVGITSAVLTSDILIWLWIVPSIVGQPFLRTYLLAEHTGCELNANSLENTRTMANVNRIVRFVAWNMPYHAEHHTNPGVPFHRLPDLHRAMADQIRYLEKEGYGVVVRRRLKSISSPGQSNLG